MDGTLAEWRSLNLNIEKYEDKDSLTDKVNRILHTSGYFYSLKPHFNVVEAIRKLVHENTIDIYILSCVLPDVPQAKSYPESEKRAWLKKYLPEIREDHCIFVPDGKNKSEINDDLFNADDLSNFEYNDT